MAERSPLGLRLAPVAIGLAGALLLLWIVLGVPGPVFYSVDGGTKLLGVQRILAEGYGSNFWQPPQAWAAQLWRGESFPFRPPFVVQQGGEWQLAFPLPFVGLSAPAFAALGWRGLYLLPLLATAITWGIVGRRYREHPWRVGLVALCVGSYASIYGATFWEHNLALALSAVSLVAPELAATPRSRFLRGLALGAAGFLRPEAWVLAACVLVGRLASRAQAPREVLAWTGGVALAGLLFVVHNLTVYGQLLGSHAQQLGANADAAAGISGMGYSAIASGLLTQLLTHSPSAWLCIGLALALPHARKLAQNQARVAALLLFVLLLPALLPNAGGRQWGPRYLIVALPLLWGYVADALAQASAAADAPAAPAAASRVPKLLVSLAVTVGLAYNLVYAARVFTRGYQNDAYKLVLALEAVDVGAVALAVPLHAGELAGYAERWPYFLARDTQELARLAGRLPPEVESLAWVVPAPAAPAGSSFRIEGKRPLQCQYQGWALAAHYVVRCDLRVSTTSAPHSTGE